MVDEWRSDLTLLSDAEVGVLSKVCDELAAAADLEEAKKKKELVSDDDSILWSLWNATPRETASCLAVPDRIAPADDPQAPTCATSSYGSARWRWASA